MPTISELTYIVNAQSENLDKVVGEVQRLSRTLERTNQALNRMASASQSSYAQQAKSARYAYTTTSRHAESATSSVQQYTNTTQRASKATRAATTRTGMFANTFRDLQSASVLAMGPLSEIGARVMAFGSIANRSSMIIAGLAGGVVAAGTAFATLAANAVTASRRMDELNSRLATSAGSMQLASEQMEFIVGLSEELAVDLDSLAEGFSTFSAAAQGSALQGEETRQIMEGIATASAALRLSADNTRGVVRALTQIMSKGQVQAEELRGQLGERLPGAFRLFAQSMNVSTEELNNMLDAGEVGAEQLTQFAQELQDTFGDDAQRMANSMSGAINNLQREWFRAGVAMNDVTNITGFLTSAINLAASAASKLREALEAMSNETRAGELTGYLNDLIEQEEKLGWVAQEQHDRIIQKTDEHIASIKEKIAAQEEAIQKQREEEEATERSAAGRMHQRNPQMQSIAAHETESEELQKLQEQLEKLQEARAKAAGIETRQVGGGDEDELSSGVQNFIDKVRTAARETNTLRTALEDMPDSADSLERVLQVNETRNELSSLNKEELNQLIQKMDLEIPKAADSSGRALARTRKRIAEELTSVFQNQEKVNEQYQERIEQLRRQPELLGEVSTRMSELRRETEAMASGRFTEEQRERTQALEQWRQKLEEAGIQGEQQERILRRLRVAMEENAEAAERLSKVREFVDSIADSLSDALTEAIKDVDNLSDAFKQLAEDVQNLIIRRAIAQPLANQVTSGWTQALMNMGGQTGGGTGGVAGNVGSGNMQQFSEGGVSNRPAMFGESGPEAAVPLPDGRNIPVDIRSGGSDDSPTVIINDQRSSDAPEVEQSESQRDGKRVLELTVRDVVNRNMARGEHDSAMRNRFGVNPRRRK